MLNGGAVQRSSHAKYEVRATMSVIIPRSFLFCAFNGDNLWWINLSRPSLGRCSIYCSPLVYIIGIIISIDSGF